MFLSHGHDFSSKGDHYTASKSLTAPLGCPPWSLTPAHQRPAIVGHSFGGTTVLQMLSDEHKSAGDAEESGYSMAFIMDGWPFPLSVEARHQRITIPVRNDDVVSA